MTSPNQSSRRVPLRRLVTTRFRTLEQRWNDADRRRASKFVAGVTNQRLNTPLDWQDIKDARDEGMTWPEIVAILDERNALAELYESGALGNSGRRFWQNRDHRLPDSFYYYHGIFG